MDNAGFTSSLLALLAVIGALAALPWLLKRWQQRQQGPAASGANARVLASVAIGPNQRVLTVEVGQGADKARLVLGVTAQSIQCLHVLGQPAVAAAPHPSSFAGAMAQVHQDEQTSQP